MAHNHKLECPNGRSSKFTVVERKFGRQNLRSTSVVLDDPNLQPTTIILDCLNDARPNLRIYVVVDMDDMLT